MNATIAGSRVKLKNHVYFGVVSDGILFDAGDTSFVLKDKSAYPIVQKLIALIDAGNPVESILERAPDKLAEFFRKVIASLTEHGMLLAVDADAPPAQGLVAHTGANELRKFLEDRLDGRSVEAELRRWHDAQVIVIGSGQSLLSALRALTDSGCAKLTVILDGAETEGLNELRTEVEAEHAVRFALRRGLGDEVPIDTAGMLVYASDSADLASIVRVEKAMREHAIAGSIGAVLEGYACVLPASRPGHPAVADLLHWLPGRGADAASLGPIAMALLGCVAAQAAICRFFGVEAATSGGQVAVVSPELEVEYRMLVASARGEGAPVPFVHPSKYQMPEGRVLLPFERIKYALEPWFDPLLGPFSIVADDQIEQVPLLQYPVGIRSASEAGKEEIVVGWGLEHAEAVVDGLSQAIGILARSFRKDDAAVVCAFDEEVWKRRALAYAVAGSNEMRQRHHWAWVDLDRLPPGPARVLHALLRFHSPDGIRAQIQWGDAGDAFIVRVSRAGATLCSVVASDPVEALTEGLGRACSMFQLQELNGIRFDTGLALPEPDDAAQAEDWHQALIAAQAATSREVEYHLLTAPGLPPSVYCGYASLKAMASAS
ncbi:hypothetical protein [Lysobacter sp. cf310]|uniref:hypothetical protein n=1 Tax=Lysobacter sp. cf310 TaxID=1761790 RepID=UPI0008F0FD07|nr:hypothetical protein [Lysobacter sp. cf310]SFK95066.1 hypothetical protein SAMN04487938_2593 [Lysobacter sp. cf310]